MAKALYKGVVLLAGVAAVVLLGLAMSSLRPHKSNSTIHVAHVRTPAAPSVH